MTLLEGVSRSRSRFILNEVSDQNAGCTLGFHRAARLRNV